MLGRAEKIDAPCPVRSAFAGDTDYSEYVGADRTPAVWSSDLVTINILEAVADCDYWNILDHSNIHHPHDADTRAKVLDVAAAFDAEAAAWEKIGD